jgi:hypothetical protein
MHDINGNTVTTITLPTTTSAILLPVARNRTVSALALPQLDAEHPAVARSSIR